MAKDEARDEAAKLRKKLGMPEFDPEETMLTSLPKCLQLALTIVIEDNVHRL